MFTKDLLIGGDHDLVVLDYDLQLTDDDSAVAQRVRRALLLFKGEWFLDLDLGIPYYEDILGTKNSLSSVRSIFVQAILDVDGVKEIKSFDMKFNDGTRELSIELIIIDDLNNIQEIEL